MQGGLEYLQKTWRIFLKKENVTHLVSLFLYREKKRFEYSRT